MNSINLDKLFILKRAGELISQEVFFDKDSAKKAIEESNIDNVLIVNLSDELKVNPIEVYRIPGMLNDSTSKIEDFIRFQFYSPAAEEDKVVNKLCTMYDSELLHLLVYRYFNLTPANRILCKQVLVNRIKNYTFYVRDIGVSENRMYIICQDEGHDEIVLMSGVKLKCKFIKSVNESLSQSMYHHSLLSGKSYVYEVVEVKNL